MGSQSWALGDFFGDFCGDDVDETAAAEDGVVGGRTPSNVSLRPGDEALLSAAAPLVLGLADTTGDEPPTAAVTCLGTTAVTYWSITLLL